MNKNRKMLLILAAALAAGLMAGALIYRTLNPMRTAIYVFRDNYKAGQAVTEQILVPVQIDSRVITGGKAEDTSVRFVTARNREELIDRKTNTLRMDVTKGMPLIQSMLSVDGGSYIEMNMDAQKVAVSVPVNSISGVSNDLKAGSRVNIYATGYGGGASTTLIFENMRILGVEKNGSASLTAATVEVSIEESLKLIDALNTSTVTFGLVNGSGYQAAGEHDLTFARENGTYSPTGALGTYSSKDVVVDPDTGAAGYAEEKSTSAGETSASSAVSAGPEETEEGSGEDKPADAAASGTEEGTEAR